MEIKKNIENKKLFVKLIGRLDTTTAPEFEKFYKEEISNIESFELDLKDLEYISSAGLRTLLSIKKEMNDREFYIINVCDTVMEVFEITGFSTILTIK